MELKGKMRRYAFKIIGLAIILIFILTGCSGDSKNKNEIQDNPTNEQQNSEEVKVESPDIARENEFNSVELNFRDISNKAQKMKIEVYAVYSKTEAYYTLEEAQDAGVIKDYTDKQSRLTFLLKNGYKYNAKLNPANKDSIANWDDSKANLPFEITATEEGCNKLTRFNILIDYTSPIVDTAVNTEKFN